MEVVYECNQNWWPGCFLVKPSHSVMNPGFWYYLVSSLFPLTSIVALFYHRFLTWSPCYLWLFLFMSLSSSQLFSVGDALGLCPQAFCLFVNLSCIIWFSRKVFIPHISHTLHMYLQLRSKIQDTDDPVAQWHFHLDRLSLMQFKLTLYKPEFVFLHFLSLWVILPFIQSPRSVGCYYPWIFPTPYLSLPILPPTPSKHLSFPGFLSVSYFSPPNPTLQFLSTSSLSHLLSCFQLCISET